MSDPHGRVIAGRYRLTRKLGSGAMGAVWLAHDEVLHRTVAAKELLLQPGLDEAGAEQARQRALREGRIAARIRHNNAVNVYDVVDDQGRPVLIMEYLQSRSLADVLAKQGSLPPREAARIGAEVASALAAAHKAGIVHRDVKPANILLGDDGSTKLTDFGISRASGDVTVTSTGMLAGSPAYLSPEAARGAEPTPASDVFALGATLYRLVEGRLPFGDQDNSIAVLHAVASGQIQPPTQAGPLTSTLYAMLAPEAANRPTMAQVQQWLQAVAGGHDAEVPAGQHQPAGDETTVLTESATVQHGAFPEPPGPPPRKSRARVYVALSAALVVIAAVVVVVLTVDFGGREPSAAAGDRVTTTTTTTSRTPEVSAADFEATVTRFYEAMPEDIDTGWSLLTPELQDVGRPRFDKYWSSLGPITIVEPAKAVGRTVIVGFEIDFSDKGVVYFQRTEMDMVVVDGKPMIDSMRRLSFERIEG